MLTDNDGRDHVTVAEAAFDADYKLQALRIDCVSNLGAYNGPYGQYIASELALKVMPGVYDVQTGLLPRCAASSPTPRRSTPTAAPGGPRRSTSSSG